MSGSAERMKPVEYYLRRQRYTGDPPGWWIGEGAERLGFGGEVTPEALRNVFRGYTPDGKRPLAQKWTPRHAGGWHFTFPVPQHVSVAFGIGPSQMSAWILASSFNAADKAVAFAEDRIAWIRGGGSKHQRAKLIVAFMPRTTSDSFNPKLQAQCLIAPVGVAPDGLVGALDTMRLLEHKDVLDASFRATLVRELHRMGFRCKPAENGFTIEGIPDKVCAYFFQRRRSAEARVLISKSMAMDSWTTHGHLRRLWRAEAARFGVTPETIVAASHPSLMDRLRGIASSPLARALRQHVPKPQQPKQPGMEMS
jgi:conjugative relaxase-like TrwC/TraI family protein